MISFCIITEGKRPQKLANLLQSIEAQGIEVETTIAVDSNHSGLLGKLRNQAVRASSGEIVIVCDDDVILEPDFCKNVLEFDGNWNVMLSTVLNPNGSRYWDWREFHSAADQRMRNYDSPDNGFICPNGALVILRKSAWEVVQWSEKIKFYSDPGEDIDFGQRLHKAGYMMTMNPHCIAHHDDNRYEQRGEGVMRIRNEECISSDTV